MGGADITPSTPVGDSFGALLRHYRLAAGQTQEALAGKAGLSIRGISDLERGVNRVPRPATLRLLADALRLSRQERTQFLARASRSDGARTAWAPLAPALPPLVGRDRELAVLQAFLAGDGPPVLLLAGPPGIGKSRLLQEARDQAEAARWRVLAAGGRRRGGQEPFAPVAAALERQLAALPSPQVRAALDGCAWLVRLLPELAQGPIEPLPPWQVSPEHERRLMFRAVARFLANLAGPAGTLLVLDDLHWAGADALDLLAALTQPEAAGLAATLTAPLRVLGAYRDTEVWPRDPFALLQADLIRAELVTHRTVLPLAAVDAQRLVQALLPDEAGAGTPASSAQIAQQTGGVPFFLVSWARHLRARAIEGGAGEELPWDLRQSIRQQVAALPEVSQAILGLAATAGRESPGAWLVAAAEQPEAVVLAALEAACQARLLHETGEGAYRFAHDVVHEVVESGIGATRRTRLHRRLAIALEGLPGGPHIEALAYHFSRAGDKEQAAVYLRLAGERAAMRHADVAAEGYYAELVALWEGLGQERDASEARERLAAVLTRRSRYTEALAALERAARAYRAAQAVKDLARVVARQGALHAEMGSSVEGMRLVQPVVAQLEPLGSSPELVELYITVDDLGLHGGETAPRLVATERALAMAGTLGDDLLLAEACGARGALLMGLGRTGEALAVLEEGRRHLEAAGTPASLGAIRLFASLFWAQSARGQQAGWRSIDRALELAERYGDPRYVAWILSERGNGRQYAGDWAGAAEDQERGLALLRQIGLSHGSGCAIGNLGVLRLLLGRLEEAACLFEESRAISERSGNALWAWSAACGLAEVARRDGRLVEARDRFLTLYARPGGRGGCMWEVAAIGLPRVLLELGEVQAAGAAVDKVAALAGGTDDSVWQIELLAVRALVATQQGHWEAAARFLEGGFALNRSVTYPYGEGRLLHASGLLFARQGQPEEARTQLETAFAILTRLGARVDLAAVAADLAVLTR